MADVPARQARYLPKAAGEYIFGRDASDEHVSEFVFSCPCGCGRVRSAAIRTAEPSGGGMQWEWNGDLQRPTLSPGFASASCSWRGRLIDGIFRAD